MMTPNGRFVTNRRLCLSISDFHPESWNPSWRVETILTGLLSFMIDEDEPVAQGTMGCLTSERRKFAQSSFFCNKRDPAFRRLFPELLDDSKFDPQLGYSLHGHAGAGGETELSSSSSPSSSSCSPPSPSSPSSSRSASLGYISDSGSAGEDASSLLVFPGSSAAQTVTRGCLQNEGSSRASTPARELTQPSNFVGSERVVGDRGKGNYGADLHLLLELLEKSTRDKHSTGAHSVHIWRQNESSSVSNEPARLPGTDVHLTAALLLGGSRTKMPVFDGGLFGRRAGNLGGTTHRGALVGTQTPLAAAAFERNRSINASGHGTPLPPSLHPDETPSCGANRDSTRAVPLVACPPPSSVGCDPSCASQRGAGSVDRDASGGVRAETSHAEKSSTMASCIGPETRTQGVSAREGRSSKGSLLEGSRNKDDKNNGDRLGVEDPEGEAAPRVQGERNGDASETNQHEEAARACLPTPNPLSSYALNRTVPVDKGHLRYSDGGDKDWALQLLKLLQFLKRAEAESRNDTHLRRYLSHLLQTKTLETRDVASFLSRGKETDCVPGAFSPPDERGRSGTRGEARDEGEEGNQALRRPRCEDKHESEGNDAKTEDREDILEKQTASVRHGRQDETRGSKRLVGNAEESNAGVGTKKRPRYSPALASYSGLDEESKGMQKEQITSSTFLP
ncbi:ubiquitin-conjugating enzyme, related [Neospora caninum Liverpool]|nr:ubiquitin-conjugating enzyme, related [Neospora caninum Liverpool]CBZ49834.1 ubiquitin-conjugating enzyme, related [Neospora caninum Liverpool]|eukprot:XP_003879869.1 ubiquitin-conjugating enzyme, related [Neospora caninum Liverpool]